MRTLEEALQVIDLTCKLWGAFENGRLPFWHWSITGWARCAQNVVGVTPEEASEALHKKYRESLQEKIVSLMAKDIRDRCRVAGLEYIPTPSGLRGYCYEKVSTMMLRTPISSAISEAGVQKVATGMAAGEWPYILEHCEKLAAEEKKRCPTTT